MLRSYQVCRLPRPTRLRLAISRRPLVSYTPTGKSKTGSSRRSDDLSSDGSVRGIRRLEAEDSLMAKELAIKYLQTGFDVRGELLPSVSGMREGEADEM
jgi:hypothetical protein